MLRMSIQPDPSSDNIGISLIAGNSPRQQFEIRSMLTLPKNLEWGSSIKYVSNLVSQGLPGYARLDTRLGWRVGESWELSVSGQNLAARRHLEFQGRLETLSSDRGRAHSIGKADEAILELDELI